MMTMKSDISRFAGQRLTFRFRDFCQFFKGFGLGFGEFGFGKKVSVSVSENLASEKKSQFWRIWSRKKVSVSENLVSKKKVLVLFSDNLSSEKKKEK